MRKTVEGWRSEGTSLEVWDERKNGGQNRLLCEGEKEV